MQNTIFHTFSSSGRKNWGLSQPPASPKKAPLTKFILIILIILVILIILIILVILIRGYRHHSLYQCQSFQRDHSRSNLFLREYPKLIIFYHEHHPFHPLTKSSPSPFCHVLMNRAQKAVPSCQRLLAKKDDEQKYDFGN